MLKIILFLNYFIFAQDEQKINIDANVILEKSREILE